LWSQARYDLGLSDEEFYRLTPSLLSRLLHRHREALAHSEMCSALTTAAVINHSMCPPEKAVSWIDFAPHHNSFNQDATPKAVLTDAQRQMIQAHEVAALELAAKMRQGTDTHA
jgi:hypothetical protein